MNLFETSVIGSATTFFVLNIFAAFHEAIGDAIALSVATPKHLQTLGLIQKSVDDTAHDVNFLFALALDKVGNFVKVYNLLEGPVGVLNL